MTKTKALPRLAGATALLAAALVALVLPAASLAAPPEGSVPLVVSPSPGGFAKTTVGNQAPTTEVGLYNEGEEEAPIEKISIEGADPGSFYFNGHNCGSLFQYQNCSMWIGFQPGGAGEKQATVVIAFKNGRPAESFAISGTGVEPQLTLAPGSYDFGLQRVYESRSAYFQLTNSGEAPVQLNNLGIDGGSGAFWTGNSNCWGGWLAPGDSCSLEVWFSAQDAAPYEAELQATSNGYTFSAELKGEGGRAVIDASPNPVDFGAAAAGTKGGVRTVVLTNSGNVAAGFFIGIVAGGDSGSFQLLTENCSGAELQPGDSCSATVRFAPLSSGAKMARLAFFGDSDAGAQVMLEGEGIAPAVTLVPSAHDFGAQAGGTASAPHAFAVRNDGGAPLDLGGVAIVGADLDQFALAGDECSGETLAPGTECLLRVRFTPDEAGAKTAKLRVGGDAGTFAAALTGTGLESGASVADTTGQDHPSFAGRSADPRPWRHRAHRRFARGDAVPSARGRAARKASVRTRAISRQRPSD